MNLEGLQTVSTRSLTVPANIAAGIRLAAHAITWNIPRGGDFEPWLDAVKETGYAGVAIFGMQLEDFIDRPETLRHILQVRGLELAAVTCFVNDSDQWINRVLHFMAEMGVRHLACTDFDSTLTIARAVEILNGWAKVGDDLGVNVYYHNHTGGVGETLTQVEELFNALDPAHRHEMLDVGHATKDFAELPPEERAADFLSRHWDRIEFMELKDWNEATDLNTPLGEGYADFERIISLIAGGGYEGWIVVEQNGNMGPSRGRGPKECAQISRQFLRGYGL